MKTFELGFLIIVMLVVWKAMLRPVIRDYVRDKLFSLRANLRMDFLKTTKGLHDPAYLHLRNAINYRIRYIDDISLISALIVCNGLEDNSSLSREINRRQQEENTALNAHQDLSNYYLNRSSRWVTFYWVHSSLMTAAFFYGFLISSVCYWLLKRLKDKSLKAVYYQQLDNAFDQKKMQILAYSDDRASTY